MKGKFVDIWQGAILSEHPESIDYYHYLNAEEKQKVSSFIRPELQQKYIKTRGVLRKVLAGYLNEKPEEIKIKIAEYGKPFVEGEFFFNLSHTGNKFVLAVSDVSEIGIDLEQYKQRKNLAGLVKKCFSAVEIKYWESLSEQQQMIFFYQLWVRKEAFVKAIGRGIAVGLDQCVVDPEHQTRFLAIPTEYGCAKEWNIVDIPLNKGDVCAMVIKGVEFAYKQVEIK